MDCSGSELRLSVPLGDFDVGGVELAIPLNLEAAKEVTEVLFSFLLGTAGAYLLMATAA